MKQRKDDKKKTVQMLSLVTQLGLLMIVSIGMTTALGVLLDKKLNTSFWTVILFFVGAIAGGQAVYRTIQKTFDDDEK